MVDIYIFGGFGEPKPFRASPLCSSNVPGQVTETLDKLLLHKSLNVDAFQDRQNDPGVALSGLGSLAGLFEIESEVANRCADGGFDMPLSKQGRPREKGLL